MHLIVLLVALPAFALSWLATAVARRWAPRLGLLDHPDARKAHQQPTPLGGGVAIWLSVTATLAAVHLAAWYLSSQQPAGRGQHSALSTQHSALSTRHSSLVTQHWLLREIRPHLPGVLAQARRLWLILAAATLLMLLGLLDDRRNLSYRPRLAVQLLVALALAAAGVRLTLFLPSPWLSGLVTVGWIVVLINAFNFLDNMDGLSAGVAVLCGTLLTIVMLQAGDQPHLFVAGFTMVVVGAAAGFLCHNWPPARIFMGDAGSGFLGLMLAVATVLGTFHEPGLPRHALMAPLCILAVPLYDFVSVILIRLLEGRSPFYPDRRHFSHRLVELDLSPRSAVLTVYLATLATGLGALLLYQVRHWSAAAVIFAMVVCILGVIAILETAGRQRKR